MAFLTATTPYGLSALLTHELKSWGMHVASTRPTHVQFEGGLAEAYRVCLWSRLANRVYMPLTRCAAADTDQLYREALEFPWEEHLTAQDTLAVDCTLQDAAITHNHYAALKLKDAIVDRFRNATGERPSIDLQRPSVRFHVHIHRRTAAISLDLAGTSLHERGYRTAAGEAPLKENLAAALLLWADWPRIAQNGGGLVDPLCGAGTLLIEGAGIALNKAPGLGREYFGFLGWRGHDASLWERLRSEALAQVNQTGVVIYGRDGDAAMVDTARANVARAGLSEVIQIEQADLATALPISLPAFGLVATNPPYGERLGVTSQLRAAYAQIGGLTADRGGWATTLVTSQPELASFTGRNPNAEHTVFNGALECRVYVYDPAPAGTALSGGEDFANRLRKNMQHLGKWARRAGISCYRLYDADLPDYVLAIDLYQGPRGRWLHVQEYRAPNHIDPLKAQRRLQLALKVLPEITQIPLNDIYLKTRERQKGSQQYQKHASEQQFFEITEGPGKFWVNFGDYLDTGIFLDHRQTRMLIHDAARDQHFLNLFGYTGTATVYAALGGAASTTTVDLSKTYQLWAQRNLALNGLSGPHHRFIQADCMAWLDEQAHSRGARHYGLIFIDPPTFSNSKRLDDVFDVQRDHVDLIALAMTLLAPGGKIIFSNNFKRFKLDAASLPECRIEDVSRRTLPQDYAHHPDIHRAWLITRATDEG